MAALFGALVAAVCTALAWHLRGPQITAHAVLHHEHAGFLLACGFAGIMIISWCAAGIAMEVLVPRNPRRRRAPAPSREELDDDYRTAGYPPRRRPATRQQPRSRR